MTITINYHARWVLSSPYHHQINCCCHRHHCDYHRAPPVIVGQVGPIVGGEIPSDANHLDIEIAYIHIYTYIYRRFISNHLYIEALKLLWKPGARAAQKTGSTATEHPLLKKEKTINVKYF